MPKMPKLSKNKPIELIVDMDKPTDSGSEESDLEPQKLEKPKRSHIMTEARKLAFEKAQQKKRENFLARKAFKEKQEEEFQKAKSEKLIKKQKKEDKRRQFELNELETSDDEPIIVKKKKSKRRVVYISDDDKSEKNIIIVNKLDSKPPVALPQPKPIKRAVFL